MAKSLGLIYENGDDIDVILNIIAKGVINEVKGINLDNKIIQQQSI